MCHDYKAPDRDQFVWETTVAEEREKNIHVRDGITEDEFVEMREARDKTLAMPRLILPSATMVPARPAAMAEQTQYKQMMA